MKVRVLDAATNNAMEGATISVNGKAVAQTNSNGEASFEVTGSSDQITVSYSGYQTESYTSAGIGSVVYLVSKSTVLPEIVIKVATKRNLLLLGVVAAVAIYFYLKFKKKI